MRILVVKNLNLPLNIVYEYLDREVTSLVLCRSGFAPLTGSNSFKTPEVCCVDIYCYYVYGISLGSPWVQLAGVVPWGHGEKAS